MTTQELVIEWSDRLFLLLEEYRAQNPNFKYWLRQINKEKRLSHGQWFQGNHKYIFIGFYNVGAAVNRTRSIGFIVNFDEQKGFFITLDVITEGESDPPTLALYKKIVASIPGFEKKTDTKYINYLGKENIEDTLLTFLDQQKPIIDSLIDEFGLKDKFIIPDESFDKALSKVNKFRNRFKAKELNKKFWKYSPGSGAVTWEDNKRKSEMAISDNNNNIGSLLHYASKDELNEKIGLARNAKSNETWNLILFRDAKVGDVILANKGVASLIGIGIIEDVYQYDANREYQHFRKVKWIADKVWDYTPNYFLGYTTLFRLDTFSPSLPGIQIITAYLKKYPEYTDVFRENGLLLEEQPPKPILNNNKKTPMPPINQILYGPPGTGKTFKIQNEFVPVFSDEIVIDANNRITWLKSIVKKMPWWKIIASVLYKTNAPIEVAKIAEDELIVAKYQQTKTKPAQYIWNELLSYGDKTSSGLSDKYRGKYEVFKKDSNSKWSLINRSNIESVIPDVVKLATEAQASITNTEVENKRYSFITFHQSYSYEDFIKGIRPRIEEEGDGVEEGDLGYHYHQGIFYTACLEALRMAGIDSFDEYAAMPVIDRKKKFASIKDDSSKRYAVFIDEINRGNIASIFGELITLIEEDKRLGAENEMLVELPYTGEYFGVPGNLYIIGTMNTADRSVEALDTALRRRFSFEFMPPMPELLVDDNKQETKLAGVSLKDLLSIINKRIAYLLDEDHQIGHSYFMKLKDESELKEAFKNKIIPLLKEYFYNDYGKIRMILGGGFVKKKEGKDSVPKFAEDDDFIAEKITYEIISIDDKFDLNTALQKTVKNA